MAITASVCPRCRERIPVDDSREKIYCMYCGNAIDMTEFTKGLDAFISSSGSSAQSVRSESGAITIRGSSANATVTLFVDKKAFCKVKKEEIMTLDIQPGKHVLWARSGFEGAEKVEMDISAGDRLEIVHNGMKGYSLRKI